MLVASWLSCVGPCPCFGVVLDLVCALPQLSDRLKDEVFLCLSQDLGDSGAG